VCTSRPHWNWLRATERSSKLQARQGQVALWQRVSSTGRREVKAAILQMMDLYTGNNKPEESSMMLPPSDGG
jgi:hypothetical protein